jgi:hypothetical protein
VLATAIGLQVVLLLYHQITTQLDLFPFNGARFCTWQEKALECTVNGVLMSLAPVGFAFGIRAMMWFGVVYYLVLFAEELRVWWVPYLFGSTARWKSVYDRMHSATIKVLPARGDNPVPNLEHTILHALTAITASVTLLTFIRDVA